MNPEGWRGTEALNPPKPKKVSPVIAPGENAAVDFWRAVAPEAEPDEYGVGTVVTMEITMNGEVLERRIVRITDVVVDDKGHHVQFEPVRDGEKYVDSGLVMVVEQ